VILTLLQHQWKDFWRSRSAVRNIAMQIFMAFFVMYILGIAVFAGFSLNWILTKVFPHQDVVTIFCGFILYYFSFDIITRFILQDLPTLAVQPYLAHNIKRSQLIKFLNLRSFVSVFTLLPFLLFVPFTISQIGSKYGGIVSFAFIISIISLTVFNHFLVLYIKRKSGLSSWWLISFFVLVLIVIAADYFGIFSMRNISSLIFTGLLNTPILVITTVLLAIASYYNNYRFLRSNLYFDNEGKSKGAKSSSEYTWLHRFGNIGDLVANDLKLILRNKRPRSLLIFSVIFLLYGFMFYKPQFFDRNQMGFLLFGAIFVTGMFITNYGQFLFAWQSDHFDGLMSNNISIKMYLKSKLILLTAFCTIAFCLTMFYGFMSWKIIPVQIAAYFFNIGVHTVLAGYIATWNYKAIDLSKGSSFNYQGIGAAQWLYGIILMLVAVVLYLPFAFIFSSWVGVAAIGIFGLINLALRNWWIDKLVIEFRKRKYKILEGFREK
jgi:hypothetical protein